MKRQYLRWQYSDGETALPLPQVYPGRMPRFLPELDISLIIKLDHSSLEYYNMLSTVHSIVSSNIGLIP